MNQTFESHSTEDTEKIGAELAKSMKNDATIPSFLALYGDLGVGKTAFVRGFVHEFAENAAVRSPTFSLVYEYKTKTRPVFHFDMYRIDSEDDLYSIGFFDYLNRDGICLAEWSEKIPFALPEEYLRIVIEKTSFEKPEERKISIRRMQKGDRPL